MGCLNVRLVGLMVLLMAAVMLTGCGDNASPQREPPAASTASTAAPTASSTATAAPAMTHAEFVRKLDATCTGSLGALRQEFDAAGDDMAKLAPVVHKFRGFIDDVISKQRKLRAPAGDRAAFRRYLMAQQRTSGTYARLEAALRANNLEQGQYLVSVRDDLRATRTRAALDLGLERCGS